MNNFTLKCNKCESSDVDISVTVYNKQDHSYELMVTCNECGDKEEMVKQD